VPLGKRINSVTISTLEIPSWCQKIPIKKSSWSSSVVKLVVRYYSFLRIAIHHFSLARYLLFSSYSRLLFNMKSANSLSSSNCNSAAAGGYLWALFVTQLISLLVLVASCVVLVCSALNNLRSISVVPCNHCNKILYFTLWTICATSSKKKNDSTTVYRWDDWILTDSNYWYFKMDHQTTSRVEVPVHTILGLPM